jgi:hypothetical protein
MTSANDMESALISYNASNELGTKATIYPAQTLIAGTKGRRRCPDVFSKRMKSLSTYFSSNAHLILHHERVERDEEPG